MNFANTQTPVGLRRYPGNSAYPASPGDPSPAGYPANPEETAPPSFLEDRFMEPVRPVSLSTALLASLLAGTTSLGKNLYKSTKGEMTVGDAVGRSLVVGASATFATTVAAGAASAVEGGETTKLLIFVTVATGISYALMSAADAVVNCR